MPVPMPHKVPSFLLRISPLPRIRGQTSLCHRMPKVHTDTAAATPVCDYARTLPWSHLLPGGTKIHETSQSPDHEAHPHTLLCWVPLPMVRAAGFDIPENFFHIFRLSNNYLPSSGLFSPAEDWQFFPLLLPVKKSLLFYNNHRHKAVLPPNPWYCGACG